MKRPIFILFLLFYLSASYAQNYQCLQSGVKHYFNNSIGYLRGIRIDSMKITGDTTVYYPFHTPRGMYGAVSGYLDTTGGSWLGKEVLQLSNGTFIFDDNWHDSVVIKTQANLGDSWVFYVDSGNVYYKASVISIDTLTMAGIFDTVKSIQINAYIGAAVDTSDPLNGMQLILSKNHGFFQVPDLYTFPYHFPGALYEPGLDYYMDRSMVLANATPQTMGYLPSVNVTIFRLCSLFNPTYQQLFNFHVGDVYEYAGTRWRNGDTAWSPLFYERDSITEKLDPGTLTKYYFVDTASFPNPFSRFRTPPYDPNVMAVNNALLIDTSLMPEEYKQEQIYYYLPDDTSFCVYSPSYEITPSYMYSIYPPFYMDDPSSDYLYKINVGQTFGLWSNIGGGLYNGFQSRLVYYKNVLAICGTDHPVNVADPIAKTGARVFPNPAVNQLTIKTTSMLSHTIVVWNILGQQMLNLQGSQEKETINTTNFPAGIYSISITDEAGNRYNDKVVIAH